MTPEPFPLFFPLDARRAFANEELVRRIARASRWSSGARILDLGAGAASVLLAREFNCTVVAADSDPAVLDLLRERAKGHSATERIEVRQVEFAELPFTDGEFHGILALGRVPLPLSVATRTLRAYLAPKGRLVLTYPVKVGRFPLKIATDFWEQKLGEPLLSPREALQVLEGAGFEPEGIETMSDPELDDFYRDLEAVLAKESANPSAVKALRDEIDLHRSQGGKASVSLALLTGRRKEPGEKPPPARDSG